MTKKLKPMPAEHQVCTYDQAELLKGLGIVQLSMLEYHGPRGLLGFPSGFNKKPRYAAFNVAELGIMLPNFVNVRRVKNMDKWSIDYGQIEWRFDGNNKRTSSIIRVHNRRNTWFEREAVARAEALIVCLKAGLIHAHQVNERLIEQNPKNETSNPAEIGDLVCCVELSKVLQKIGVPPCGKFVYIKGEKEKGFSLKKQTPKNLKSIKVLPAFTVTELEAIVPGDRYSYSELSFNNFPQFHNISKRFKKLTDGPNYTLLVNIMARNLVLAIMLKKISVNTIAKAIKNQ